MQLAKIVGHAISSVKHPSLHGWRLALVQPLTATNQPDGEPVLAIDVLGSAHGQHVIVSNDGLGARQVVGHKNSPARWMVLGICDSQRAEA